MKRADFPMRRVLERADDVVMLEMSVGEVRAFIDGSRLDIEELETALDEAQGPVFTQEKNDAYMIIRIVP